VLVALMRLELRLPGCRSLKEKRHVLKGLTNGIRAKFNVSVAETGYQDKWQRSTLAIASAGEQAYHVRRVLHEVERYVDTWPDVETIEAQTTLHDAED
jgi:uncharacterized protein YlxP (DUF503 family)